MLFEIAESGSPKEVSITTIAQGVDSEYILVLEKAALKIWDEYGSSILLLLSFLE